MSWSIQKTIGEPARVRAVVEPQFNRAAESYEKSGNIAEADDIRSARVSVLNWLDQVPEGLVASVEASGSRGAGWLGIKVDCSTVKLA